MSTLIQNGSPIRLALLGDCFADVRFELLKKVAALQAFAVEGVASVVADVSIVNPGSCDIVIVFPWTYGMLRPLWDFSAIRDDNIRSERLNTLKDYLTTTIEAVALRASACTLLVNGLSIPPALPNGRLDFRSNFGYRRIFWEINEHICQLIRNRPNMYFVDEESLFANAGKRRILAEGSGSYTDYVGGSVFDQNSCGFKQSQAAMRIVAREYVDFFVLWSGRGRIKCIITDLDNTLWPGEIAEGMPGFDVTSIALSNFGGFHEALKIAKDRGILLATCSKNTKENVIDRWNQLVRSARDSGFHHLLEPDDFVLHKINWDSKSSNIRSIAGMLGFALDSLLFIDDHTVEREEVKAALPEVSILDSLSLSARYEILRDPRLESVSATQEARSRTEKTKAQLLREEERQTTSDESSFLRGLKINVHVTVVRQGKRVDRIVELIRRTHQYNITQTSYDIVTILPLLSDPDIEIYTMDIADKFTSYGLTGVCIMRSGVIDTFVMSCRVIPLKADTPFLLTAIRSSRWADQELRGRIIKTPVNSPCQQLFSQAGFALESDGWYVCHGASALVPIDTTIYNVTTSREPVTV